MKASFSRGVSSRCFILTMTDVLVPSICKREICPESMHAVLALAEFVDNLGEVKFFKKWDERTPKGLTGN